MDQSHCCRRAFLWILIGQEDAHVLDRSDYVIQRLLAPEPSPPRLFEVMLAENSLDR
jgi:hypothetical protein